MQAATVVMAIVELNKVSLSKGFLECDIYTLNRERDKFRAYE